MTGFKYLYYYEIEQQAYTKYLATIIDYITLVEA